MDELYTKCNTSITTCPSGHTCSNKTNIKCKRATALHTETCSNSSTTYYCQGAGYSLNDTITYGNVQTIEGVLTPGDAFDCDVNGDGTYDSATERFYYVSDYFDTSSLSYHNDIAVLVYYSNTTGGIASTAGSPYDSSGENWHGPVTAIQELPTTTQWSNMNLYKNSRQIITGSNGFLTAGGSLPSNFSYSGYSARLLTYQEIYHGCYDYNTTSIGSKKGLITNCKFLFERTRYASSNITEGFWLENVNDSTSDYAYMCESDDVHCVHRNNLGYAGYHGTRPAIEVPKSQILY